MRTKALLIVCLLAGVAIAPRPVKAQQITTQVDLSLLPDELDRALTEIGRRTGREIIIAGSAATGRRTPRLNGRVDADEAIRRLLTDSGLAAEFRPDVVLIKPAGFSGDGSTADDAIVVTGSRIRGAASASPHVTLTQSAIRNAGQTDLGEAARSLPQNYNGGQNPEIGIGVTGNNNNINGSSGLNLRGLGPDATLTLLNGHRLAYDGSAQGVDISAIPLAAVDRIEIVPDGASAIYGSDAVGGVANIILKRDFRGLETSVRLDVPTGGGGVQQLYTATGGGNWGSGGGLASIDINRAEAISAGQRRITGGLAPSTTLIRSERKEGALVTLHQELAPGIGLEIDALYSARRTFGETPYTVDRTARDFGNTNAGRTRAFAVAPRVIVDISPSWRLSAHGLYAGDRTRYETIGFSENVEFARFAGCLCNDLASMEGIVDGTIVDLPGGPLKGAFGGGVRRAGFNFTQGDAIDFDRSRTTRFAFGEVALPLIAQRNARAGVHQLLVSAAARYEQYDGTAGVLSPKFGAVYAPLDGVRLKASWGRSFKAPTLYQQFVPRLFIVLNAADLGYTDFPAGATIAILNGGNEALEPERARTWSATLELEPVALPNTRFSIGYFDVAFTNRVQVPVQGLFSALGNPIFDPFITYAPTPTQTNEALANASGGLDNQTGRAFDPAQVVAIVDAAFRNVTREQAAGVDVAISHRARLGAERTLDLTLDGSYLTSQRTLIPTVPAIPLAGTVFNPSRWRARASATWSTDSLTLAGHINYIAGVEDRRRPDVIKVGGQTTVDLSARLQLARDGWLRDTRVALAIRNVLDAMPDPIATSFAYATPYDSTNYSAIGRVVGLELVRRW